MNKMLLFSFLFISSLCFGQDIITVDASLLKTERLLLLKVKNVDEGCWAVIHGTDAAIADATFGILSSSENGGIDKLLEYDIDTRQVKPNEPITMLDAGADRYFVFPLSSWGDVDWDDLSLNLNVRLGRMYVSKKNDYKEIKHLEFRINMKELEEYSPKCSGTRVFPIIEK